VRNEGKAMRRLPALSRDKLSPENQAIWDRVMKGRTGGGGPYGILIYTPLMAEHFFSRGKLLSA
jgi:hypothetical protein